MRTPSMLASDFISARQRPPVPRQPTCSASLGPRTLTAGTPSAATPAARRRKERRERDMGKLQDVASRERERPEGSGRSRSRLAGVLLREKELLRRLAQQPF